MDHLNLFIVIVQIPHLVVIPVVAKIHKICSLFSVVFISVIILSCVGETRNTNEKVIDVSECQEKSFDWISLLDKNIQYVKLNTDSEKYSFSNISKLICWNNRFYVNDWRIRRLITFDDKGNPLFVLNRRGRGPEEYLQVTDFDVDDNGGLWILDGQKDVVNHYAEDGKFISSRSTAGRQYSFISYRQNGLLLGLANWDEENDAKVVQADTNLNILASYSHRPKLSDPNFIFGSVGFTSIRDTIFYNMPIDDDVIMLGSGGYYGMYHFDFGGRRVPDEVRKSIEPHFSKIHDYSFLMNVVGVFDGIAIGTMCEKTDIDFIIDIESKIMYKQSRKNGELALKGISDGKVLFAHTSSESDNDIIAYISLDEVKKSLKRNKF